MHKFGGSWSESKLDCVENYALSYLKVMQKQTWYKLDYVDAFAGRGKQALKKGLEDVGDVLGDESFFGNESDRADTEEFLIGSAIRALHASHKSVRSFDQFIFIDADKPSCNELESYVITEFPRTKDKVKVICGDANTALDDYIYKTDWIHTRAVVFLDPYGLEVKWDLIERLAETKACDVWYLFPLGGVIRMMTNNGQIPISWRDKLDQVFGTTIWFEEFYQPNRQQSWFDEDQDKRYKDASTSHVVDFIRKRLSTTFKAVSNVGILRNGKGAPLFALLLGVSNPSEPAQKAALSIANHLVKDLSK